MTAPNAGIPPASQLVCRQCGGLCRAGRIERYSAMVAAYGAGLLGVGYTALVCMGGSFVLTAVAQLKESWKQASWVPPEMTVATLPILGLVLAGVVTGHFLAQKRSVWLCTVCGTVVERSELPERLWDERQKQQK